MRTSADDAADTGAKKYKRNPQKYLKFAWIDGIIHVCDILFLALY